MKDIALVVDDEPLIVKLVTDIVKRHNDHVVSGRDGVEAISPYVANKPSLIVIDMIMPLMNGCSAAYLIRIMSKGEPCEIIFFTAESKEFLSKTHDCTVFSHIVPKGNLDELQGTIGNL